MITNHKLGSTAEARYKVRVTRLSPGDESAQTAIIVHVYLDIFHPGELLGPLCRPG